MTHPTVSDALEEGEQLMDEGAYAQALTLYRNLIDSETSRADVLNNAGVASVMLERIESGVEYFERALAERPTFGEAYVNLLDTLRSEDRYEAYWNAVRRYGVEVAESHEKRARERKIGRGPFESLVAEAENASTEAEGLGSSVRPDQSLIVTGIPRSGTSLFAALVSQIPDAVCLNEILYDVDRLPALFQAVRSRLVAGESVPNRFDSGGRLATDTQDDGVSVEDRTMGEYTAGALVASKVNVPYLFRLEKIMSYGYPVLAVVRDPVYTVASWASARAEAIPEAQVTEEEMHPRWRGIRFLSERKLDRQVELWNHLARIIWSAREHIRIVRYEDLIADPERELRGLVKAYDLDSPAELPDLSSRNLEDRYAHTDTLQKLVPRLAPMRRYLGYA